MSRVTRLLPLARSKVKRARPSLLLGVGVKVVLLKHRDLRAIPAQSQELYINKIQSIKKWSSTQRSSKLPQAPRSGHNYKYLLPTVVHCKESHYTHECTEWPRFRTAACREMLLGLRANKHCPRPRSANADFASAVRCTWCQS